MLSLQQRGLRDRRQRSGRPILDHNVQHGREEVLASCGSGKRRDDARRFSRISGQRYRNPGGVPDPVGEVMPFQGFGAFAFP
jgi:hypothetical protein